MTRGNWQRRVELNESRRAEAKEKKHRNEEKRNNKARVQDFFKLLDGSWNQLIKAKQRRRETSVNQADDYQIHVWVNVPPSDAIPLLDMISTKSSYADDDDIMLLSPKNKRKGKKRSSSIDSETGPSPRKPSNFKNKKKAHPRSHQQSSSSEKNGPTTVTMPKLSRSHFFHGKCGYSSFNQGKKGGGTTCNYAHYETKYSRTLAEIVNSHPHAKKSLSQAEQALPSLSSTQTEDGGGSFDGVNEDAMDMVFYLSIPIIPNDKSSNIIPSEHIISTLNEKSCNISSIQYLAMDEFLVFDRYQRGGLIATELEFVQAVGSTNMRGGSTSHNVADQATELPSSVLEDILLFLPDSAVAATSSVCKAWNIEIGKQSTNLWRHLLQRRGWPIPTNAIQQHSDGEAMERDQKDIIAVYRESFLAHYEAFRDVKALASGTEDLLMGGNSTSNTSNSRRAGPQYALQNFAAVEGSPPYGSHCLAIQVWSPNHILAAFSNDCTIRLYTAASRGGKNTTVTSSRDHRSCRELICHSMDPFKNTKRKSSQLLDMTMDDDMVGCLFRVVEVAAAGASFVLTTVRKEDFLSTDDLQEEDVLNVIDVGQCMLNFILSYDDENNNYYQEMDEIWRPAITHLKFAIVSGDCEIDDIEIQVSDSLESCGYGRFLLDVTVSVASEDYHDDDDDDDSDLRMTIVFRNIVLFSSSTNSIVWMADVPNNMERRINLTLACTRTTIISETLGHGRKKVAPVVVGTELAPSYSTWCVPVKYLGNAQETPLMESPISLDTVTQEDIVSDNDVNQWSPIPTMDKRPLILHDSEIIIGDTWWKEVEEDKFIYKSVVSFHPINQSSHQRHRTVIELSGNLSIVDLVPLRKTYVLVLCWKYPMSETVDDVDGHWFGDTASSSLVEDTNERYPSVVAVILDIQNRMEISRACLVGGKDPDPNWTHSRQSVQIVTSNDTLGAVLWWKGIVMAGQDIQQSDTATTKRYGGSNNLVENSPRNVKTKKKKKIKKGSKKDGFARGMSLRG